MYFRQIFIAGAVIGALLTPGAYAATVFSDNFNSNPLKLDTAPAGWVVDLEGNVNLIGSGTQANPLEPLIYDPLPGNGVYVDLIGTNDVSGILRSPSFVLQAGVDYTAQFALAGNQLGGTEVITVIFGDPGVAQQDFQLTSFSQFKTFTMNFTPTSTAAYSITFQNTNFIPPVVAMPQVVLFGSRGALLDNLVITSVPEPASYALMLAGLIGLHVVARRRMQNRET